MNQTWNTHCYPYSPTLSDCTQHVGHMGNIEFVVLRIVLRPMCPRSRCSSTTSVCFVPQELMSFYPWPLGRSRNSLASQIVQQKPLALTRPTNHAVWWWRSPRSRTPHNSRPLPELTEQMNAVETRVVVCRHIYWLNVGVDGHTRQLSTRSLWSCGQRTPPGVS